MTEERFPGSRRMISDVIRGIAQEKQDDARAAGDLLIWTICDDPSDHPGKYTARPYSARRGQPDEFLLVADTYAEILGMLPAGLVRLERDPSDPPVIVESWI
jgi:hypothetical protein